MFLCLSFSVLILQVLSAMGGGGVNRRQYIGDLYLVSVILV